MSANVSLSTVFTFTPYPHEGLFSRFGAKTLTVDFDGLRLGERHPRETGSAREVLAVVAPGGEEEHGGRAGRHVAGRVGPDEGGRGGGGDHLAGDDHRISLIVGTVIPIEDEACGGG